MEEEKKESSDTISINKNSLWKYSTFLLIAVIVIGGIYFVTQKDNGGSATTGGAVANTGGSTQPANLVIDSDDPVLGNKNAKVTVFEFTDFSCPYCAAASGDNQQLADYMKKNNPNWQPIVTNFIKDYVDTGKAKFVVKYSMGHSGGHPAQSVAWCLNDQGLFWKFYPQAFAHQSDVEDLGKMKDLAKTVGADMNKLQSCLDSKKYDAKFNKDQQEGVQAGVQGTPAFFINGKLLEGAQPYANFKQMVDAELA